MSLAASMLFSPLISFVQSMITNLRVRADPFANLDYRVTTMIKILILFSCNGCKRRVTFFFQNKILKHKLYLYNHALGPLMGYNIAQFSDHFYNFSV